MIIVPIALPHFIFLVVTAKMHHLHVHLHLNFNCLCIYMFMPDMRYKLVTDGRKNYGVSAKGFRLYPLGIVL